MEAGAAALLFCLPWGWNQEVCGVCSYLWGLGSNREGDPRETLGLGGHWPTHFDLRIQTL